MQMDWETRPDYCMATRMGIIPVPRVRGRSALPMTHPNARAGIACLHGVSRHRGSGDEIAGFDRSEVGIHLTEGLSQQRNRNSPAAGLLVEYDCRLVFAGA